MNKCISSGVCCELFLINLNEDEYKSGKYKTEFEEFGIVKNFIEAELTGMNLLKQKNAGGCIYLKDKKCTIHNTRPKVCRKFFCTSDKEEFKEMIIKINRVKEERKIEIIHED
ncbi:MAG: YkgJ family cysteine cluster protein [Nanoarchaeota archaeon]|nr:YkgJ family cysteine cluster protein [Nanoarchaeota archaeon]MBU1030886.1 YkgJ family cysteine cluster protein [Nanoarchaeota archaeon]MBU1849448.1 YkgJ family cysteine cluster protein [Nanoarchaeota archaeon]